MWLDGNGFTESSVAGWVGEVLPMEEAAIASRQANWNGVLVQQCHWKPSKIHQKLNFLEFGERYTLGMADSPSSGENSMKTAQALRNDPSRSINCYVDAGGDRKCGSRNWRSGSLGRWSTYGGARCSGSRPQSRKLTVADCATIPVSVIHSVERTQETLVLDDAVSESPFQLILTFNNRRDRSSVYPFSIKASWSASFI